MTPEKVSIAEALLFDLRRPESSDEASLSEWRIAIVTHVALLLGVTHVLITAACVAMFTSRGTGLSMDNPLIPAGLVIAVDAAAATALVYRQRLNLHPHTVVRSLCGYLGIVGLLWAWFGQAVADDTFVTPMAAAPIAMAAGIAMGAVVSVQSPPLIIMNMVMSVLATFVLSDTPLVPAAILVLSMALVAYSIANTRSFIAAGRKRLNLDAEARKASKRTTT